MTESSLGGTRQRIKTVLRTSVWEETKEGDTVGGARLTIEIGAEFPIGIKPQQSALTASLAHPEKADESAHRPRGPRRRLGRGRWNGQGSLELGAIEALAGDPTGEKRTEPGAT
jgi:hypothetical protein